MRLSISLMYLLLLTLVFSCKKEPGLPDANGEKLSKIMFSGQASGTIQYLYNSQGKVSQVIHLSGTGDSATQVFTYNASGQMISCLQKNNAAGDIFRNDFEYDGNGRIVKSTGVAILPSLMMDDALYSYDTNGRLIKDETVNSFGNVSSYRVYEYDANNNVVAQTQYRRNGTDPFVSDGRITYEYDTKRNPYYQSGLTFFIANGASGGDYVYLSKNNPVKTFVNGVVDTNWHIAYEYYSNDLLHTGKLGLNNTVSAEYFYQ